MSMNPHGRVLLLVVLGLSIFAAAAPSTVSAQTTFTACRVPDVGAIYMIGLQGLPDECLDPSHVEFSWTEGGSVADGSVTTAKLADGAVASAKLAADAVDSLSIRNGSILGEDLRPGTVRSTEIGDRSITSADVGYGTLLAENFAEGAAGAIIQESIGNTGLLSTTPTAIGDIAYTAPAEGQVLILVTGSAYIGGDDTEVRIGIGGSPGSTTMHSVAAGHVAGSGTAARHVPFTTMAVVPILVGGISRYYVSAWIHSSSSANTASLVGVRAVLVYVPTGNVPTGG